MSDATAQYACPHCQGLFQVAVSDAAQTVACPHCDRPTTIAASTADTAAIGAAADGTLAPTPSTPRRKRRSSQVTGWFLLLGLLVAVVAVAVFAGGRFLSGLKRTTAENTSDDEKTTRAEPLRPDDGQAWTDASKRSQALEGYQVKVSRAELGPMLGRDSTNAVETLQEDGLQIGLQIRNMEPGVTKPYKSWYAASREGDDEAYAQLSDNIGNVYPLLYFKDIDELRGHTAQAELSNGLWLNDVLFFEVPSGVDRNRVKYLHLRLEAAPLGQRGRFQFEIPISMVHNWH